MRIALQHFDLRDCRGTFRIFSRGSWLAKRGRNMQRKYHVQRSESNVAFERTPLATLAAAPRWSACMPGSSPFSTPLSDSLLACHKRKLPAGVTLNSSS